MTARVVRSARFAQRRREVAGERRRRRRRGIVAGLVLSAAIGTAWWVTHSSLSQVTEIRVVGAKRVDPAAVTAASGIRVGDNVFSVDAAAAERGILRRLDLVDSATVERDGVSGVRIVVRERLAVLAVRTPYGTWYADRSGRPVAIRKRPPDLPVLRVRPEPARREATAISAVDALTASSPTALAPPGLVRSIVALHDELPAWLATNVEWFEVSDPSLVTLRWKGARVLLGRPDRIAEKLRALSLVARRARTEGLSLVRLDLRAPKRPAAVLR